MQAPLAPVCSPALAEAIRAPEHLLTQHLLRSYRQDEWPLWFRMAGLTPPVARGWVFDNSLALVEAAAQGFGVALVPAAMFARDIASGRIVQPLDLGVATGSYWLTRLKSRAETSAMVAFKEWIIARVRVGSGSSPIDQSPPLLDAGEPEAAVRDLPGSGGCKAKVAQAANGPLRACPTC
jgi:LysR family transcriptional regulator of beta-lactamase